MPGSAGIAVVGLRAEGGEATLTTNAFCSVAVGIATAAAKKRCVESGSQAGRPIWPLVIVDIDKTHARGKRRRPNDLEGQWCGGAAWRELHPAFVLALDQQRVARRRPAERMDHCRIEKLARKSVLVVDDPQTSR